MCMRSLDADVLLREREVICDPYVGTRVHSHGICNSISNASIHTQGQLTTRFLDSYVRTARLEVLWQVLWQCDLSLKLLHLTAQGTTVQQSSGSDLGPGHLEY